MSLSRFHLDQMLLVDINKLLAELVELKLVGFLANTWHLSIVHNFLIEPYSLVFVKAILKV